MKFKVGDRVVSTTLPPLVYEDEHEIGSEGVVVEIALDARINGQCCPYLVEFTSDRWYCFEHGLELAIPLPSIGEALSGLMSILQEME